jgi:cytochrome c-type biogenesis protein CcmH
LILPFLLALLAFGALLPIVAPLLRGNRPVGSRGSFDQAVYRDQLRELDRDIARGVISPGEADAARLEIQRRLLAADKLPATAPRLSRSPLLALVVAVTIAAGSVSGYVWLGAPTLPDIPFAAGKAQTAQDHSPASLQKATADLAAKLRQNPSDAAGWLLYGRSLVMLSQWDQAEDAYRHAMDLGENSPDIAADHAEVLVMQAGGVVTPAADIALRQVLKADPDNGLARYYLAVAAMQAGEPRQAIDGFQALLAELPEASPLRAQLGLKVAEAARAAGVPVPALAKGPAPQPDAGLDPGPAPGTGSQPGPDSNAIADAANMTEAQRQEMIRGMVANLAAKQDADPNNVDGWLRLGRAYAVLHETDKAAAAYEKAAELRPSDVSIPLQEMRALMSDRAPADKLPSRVTQLLKRVEATDPDQPLVLWYLGMQAAQDANPDAARRYWSKLLAKLPQGSEDAKMIQSALDAIAKR